MDKYKPIRRTSPLKILRNLAIVVAVIMVISFAWPRAWGAVDARRDIRQARADVLYDFDYIMHILVDNFPYFPLIYRRTGVYMPDLIPDMRTRLADTSYPPMERQEFIDFLNTRFFDYGQRVGHLMITPTGGRVRIGENLFTEIIDEGRIAYLRIATMIANNELTYYRPSAVCFEIVDPFFQQIEGFEHLIIDIRGNFGGFFGYFEELVMRPLQHTVYGQMSTVFYHFYRNGEHNADNAIGFMRLSSWMPEIAHTSHFWASFIYDIERNMESNPDFLTEILGFDPLPEYVLSDIMATNHFFAQRIGVRSTPYNRRNNFNGKIWLLIDDGVASAAQQSATFAKESGFATLVGEISGGIPGFGFFITLPNTGIRIRYDPTFMTDQYGRPLEYGTIPHYFNREGMDALETVLAMIAEMSEIMNYELLITD